MVNARIIWKSVGISLVAALLITAVVLGVRMRPSEQPCRTITYIIEDQNERLYLTPNELNQVLVAEHIYPVGRTLDRGLIHRIEQVILHHPMVRTAECYVTPRYEVRVRLTQRVPLLRVQMPGDIYFIDTDRKVMPVRTAVTDKVLVATGAVGPQFAAHQLADFALWLQDNKYWHERVHHVHVQSPQMVYVYMKGENQPRAVLGNMTRYEQKLTKLRTFLENSPEEVQAKQYTELDLRFRGQVIGRN